MNYLTELVRPGMLVFDLGANRGTKTAQYLARGASVVCVEPQPALAQHLSHRFRDFKVIVEPYAVSSAEGSAEMLLCDQSDTISTLEPKWLEGRFKGTHTWSGRLVVPCTTLDALVSKHGCPGFTKIDVEAHEAQVLAGLHTALPALSFEYHVELRDDAAACCERLLALGSYEFNMGRFHTDELVLPTWAPASEVLARIPAEGGGDIYARLRP